MPLCARPLALSWRHPRGAGIGCSSSFLARCRQSGAGSTLVRYMYIRLTGTVRFCWYGTSCTNAYCARRPAPGLWRQMALSALNAFLAAQCVSSSNTRLAQQQTPPRFCRNVAPYQLTRCHIASPVLETLACRMSSSVTSMRPSFLGEWRKGMPNFSSRSCIVFRISLLPTMYVYIVMPAHQMPVKDMWPAIQLLFTVE